MNQGEYTISKKNKNIIYGSMIVACLLALRGYYLYTESNEIEWLITSAVPLLATCVILPILFFKKVLTNPSSITIKSFFSSNTISINDILGYHLVPVPKSMKYKIVLISKSTGKQMSIPYSNMENRDGLLQWVQQNFNNLDK